MNSMRDLSTETFRRHLLEKYSLPPKARARVERPSNSTLARPLRELWEATDLSAAEFADEHRGQVVLLQERPVVAPDPGQVGREVGRAEPGLAVHPRSVVV